MNAATGFRRDSSFDWILRHSSSPEEILARLAMPGSVIPEQWQVQIQALIQRRAEVLLFSSLPEAAVRAAHLGPCRDIGAEVNARLKQDPDARVAVIPQGPLTIPDPA